MCCLVRTGVAPERVFPDTGREGERRFHGRREPLVRCQLIDLVDMDNPRYLRWWRQVEVRMSPLVASLDARLPRGVARTRKRGVSRLKSVLGGLVKPRRPASRRERTRDAPRHGPPRLVPGDLVRVKSLEAVEKTLDARGMCGGLSFMPVQRHYCGKTFRVLKRVETFLDERDFRVKRLKRVVLLEGVTCDGSPLEPDACDRTCFLFWKEAWLEKVSPGAGPGAGEGR